jgi:hypothetical protein
MSIKSLQGYRQKVLGLRFKGVSTIEVKSSEYSAKNQSTLNSTPSVSVGFLLDATDHEAELEMIEKIQKLFKTAPTLFFHKDDSKESSTDIASSFLFFAQNLFIFGRDLKIPDQITYEDVHVFDSFSDISKDQNLKKSLWLTLKNYT